MTEHASPVVTERDLQNLRCGLFTAFRLLLRFESTLYMFLAIKGFFSGSKRFDIFFVQLQIRQGSNRIT